MADSASGSGPRGVELATFQQRLRRLLDHHQRVTGRPWSYRRISEEIRQAELGTLSPTYLSELVSGENPNPTITVLQRLARFFGVPTSYFTDDELAGRVNDQLDQLVEEQRRRYDEAQRGSLAHVMFRWSELSDQGREQVQGMLDYVHQLEQHRRVTDDHE